jgi:isoleucyl-tRNA synthetase
VIYDERAKEWEPSSFFEGKEWSILKDYYDKDYLNDPKRIFPDGESFAQTIKRMGDFIYDLESKYSNKNIMIVGHATATEALDFVLKGLSLSDLSSSRNPLSARMENAEIRKFDFIPTPHNEYYELDLHRPYIDEVNLVCECGGNLVRTKEVMDVWLDSGAMPFAQDHYPFENKKWVDGVGYPADFISEAIDQTRGWFYTLHAIGVLMGRGKAYKNVICLGHLLDAKGKKMSKSLGNIVDPWEAMDKYGVDTLRLWMYSVNQPGESKNFDEKTVALLHQQVFGLLYNVIAFYELYRDKELEISKNTKSGNILDQWILARLNELVKLSTDNLDNYKLLEPTRAIRDFVGDLSTWYLRRSRERIKEGDKDALGHNHSGEAKQTLYFVLKTLAKVMAPFAPLSAEDIWLKLKDTKDEESVHLAKWPKVEKINTQIIEDMKKVREIVTLGLEARQKAGIKVRQPLGNLKVKNFSLKKEFIELIQDEINVKEIIVDEKIEEKVLLDTEISEELKQEGDYRELVREMQDMRKNMGLTPSDVVSVVFETDEKGKKLIKKFETDMKKTVLVSQIKFGNNEGQDIKIDELVFKIKIEK